MQQVVNNANKVHCSVCQKQIDNPFTPLNSTDSKVKLCSAECFGYYRNVRRAMKQTGWKVKFTEVNVERIVLFICLTAITWIFITTTNACGMQCMAYNHNLHSMAGTAAATAIPAVIGKV